MVFLREAPRAVEVMTSPAQAPSSSSPSPSPHASVMLRAKPRSRLPLPPPLRSLANHHHRLPRCDAPANGPPAPPSSSPPPPAPGPRRGPPGARDDGFERIRARLMDHLREAAGRIELPAVAHGEGTPKEPEQVDVAEESEAVVEDEFHAVATVAFLPQGSTPANPVSAPASAEELLPWNLRTRRSAPATVGRHGPDSPARPSPRLRSGPPERREAALRRRRRPRFSVPLTKEEIDEDLYAFTGRLAARRPKKRARPVQKQLDMLFPGLCLSEVTVDMYQVADPPPPPPS